MIFQLTDNILMDSENQKLYDIKDGSYIGHLNISTEQLIYNEDCPEKLKQELGLFLMTLKENYNDEMG